MKTTIKQITLHNFKGCKRKEPYVFDGKNVTVCGANGSGKTTINTSYNWVMADKDTELHSNPPIRPIDVEECTPRVDIILDIYGREVSVAKLQKQTKKGNSVSLSNTYEVNAVEYGERDFKAKMAEYGIDFDLFLPLSHPDYFTSQKSADMRKVLFAMASEKTDYEIASNMEALKKEYESFDKESKANCSFDEFLKDELEQSETGDVAILLKNYTSEEVKAMQNATLRKIKEVYGKDGEILRAKIEGMEQSKVDIDVAELELQRNALKEQIAENKAKQDDVSKQFEEYQKLSDGIMELKFAEGDLQRKANEELINKKKELQAQIDEKNDFLINTGNGIQKNNREIAGYEFTIENQTKQKERLAELWKSVNTEVFDENTTICPTCHREFPAEEIESLRSAFEKSKAERLAKIEKDGMECKQDIDNAKTMIPKLEECNKDNLSNKEKLEKEVADIEKQLSELPTSIDISETEEYKAIHKQIAEKEQAMSQMNSADEIRQDLRFELNDLQNHLVEIEKQIALSQRNIEIDEQIADLRNKQSEYEQNKADAEKILYQLDLVSKRKNELLTDDINKHFDIVRWQMFEYLKNGEIKDCCIPLIDGKRFGESTNKGREILAKLDIIKGLQKFYGQYYPVFLDNAESLSEETLKRIDMPCQLILLKVTEDMELRIEVG